MPTPATDIDLATAAELGERATVSTSVQVGASAGSGHPTSSLSAADLMAVLFARHLHYDWDRPDRPGNDHLIFSKGHASPLLYSLFKAVGAISDQELMETYRQVRGRPCRATPRPSSPGSTWPPARSARACPTASASRWPASGSTSSTTASGCCAATARLAEGSIWEALDKASHYELNNLTAIVDVNRLGQRGPTELEWDMEDYRRRVESFGCTGRGDRRPRRRGRSTRRSRSPSGRAATDRHPGPDDQGQRCT